jgi:hypothetical protein
MSTEAAHLLHVPPYGFVYSREFLDRGEEARLLEFIGTLPLEHARYREFTAHRRIVSFGGRYDFSERQPHAADAIPTELYPLRNSIAELMGVPPDSIHHASIAEYAAGTARLAPRRAGFRDRRRRVAARSCTPALSSISARQGRPDGAEPRPRAALGLRDPRRRALALGTQHPGRAKPAILDHLPHAANRRHHS